MATKISTLRDKIHFWEFIVILVKERVVMSHIKEVKKQRIRKGKEQNERWKTQGYLNIRIVFQVSQH